MDLIQILKREEESKGQRVFLYIEGSVFKAYECSAYVLSQCFEDFCVQKEYLAESGAFVLTGMAKLDFLMWHEEFQLLVGDDFIEVTIPASQKYELSKWKSGFEELKRLR